MLQSVSKGVGSWIITPSGISEDHKVRSRKEENQGEKRKEKKKKKKKKKLTRPNISELNVVGGAALTVLQNFHRIFNNLMRARW